MIREVVSVLRHCHSTHERIDMSSVERIYQSVLRISHTLYNEETKNELDVILNDACDEIASLKAQLNSKQMLVDNLYELVNAQKQLEQIPRTARKEK